MYSVPFQFPFHTAYTEASDCDLENERLHCLNFLKLYILEERRNGQDLVEVFKRLELNELFTLDDNIRGTRKHSWKLVKFRCTLDYCKYLFSNSVIDRWNQLEKQVVGAFSISAFKRWLSKI